MSIWIAFVTGMGVASALWLVLGRRREPRASQPEPLLQAQRLMDALPVPTFVKDEAGRYIYVSPNLCERCGLTREQVLGRTIDDLNAPPGLVDAYQEQERALWAGEVAFLQNEHRLEQADGRTMLVLKTLVDAPASHWTRIMPWDRQHRLDAARSALPAGADPPVRGAGHDEVAAGRQREGRRSAGRGVHERPGSAGEVDAVAGDQLALQGALAAEQLGHRLG